MLNKLKIGIIIPDRNDRPEFLQYCKKMLAYQELDNMTILVVDYPAKDSECDICLSGG